MAYKVMDIANKILADGENCNAGELVTNLKLQKLLYYMQGFHIAYFNEPLFDEEIEAWQYGPVVPDVYNYYKDNGSNGIEANKKELMLEPKEEALFSEVLSIYGQYSAIGLMNMTHNETPWKSTPTGYGSIISKEKLKNFFKKRLK